MNVRYLVELSAERELLNKQGKTCLVLAEESLDLEIARLGGPKRRAKLPPAVKGSYEDRLNAIVDFLYQKEGRNRAEEKQKAVEQVKKGAAK